ELESIKAIIEENFEIVQEEEEEVVIPEEEEYTCPDCGSIVTPEMTHCPSCGVELSFEFGDDQQA
ncbi:MAG: transcription termination/antitermination protein NusA, partial [Spirochaetia bacterium]|nr:transcription termination/antitermination protein NusA [Spirochaetia bacterium]